MLMSTPFDADDFEVTSGLGKHRVATCQPASICPFLSRRLHNGGRPGTCTPDIWNSPLWQSVEQKYPAEGPRMVVDERRQPSHGLASHRIALAGRSDCAMNTPPKPEMSR